MLRLTIYNAGASKASDCPPARPAVSFHEVQLHMRPPCSFQQGPKSPSTRPCNPIGSEYMQGLPAAAQQRLTDQDYHSKGPKDLQDMHMQTISPECQAPACHSFRYRSSSLRKGMFGWAVT